MSEEERTRKIVLKVDQQVFTDVVHGDESIEEYSAPTEVVTFEQRGESFFLEGNILFSAFLREPEELSASVEASSIKHMRHRMAFDLRVPVSGQSQTMLSVSVEMPEAELSVLGPGWVHVKGLLEIAGLDDCQGYVAHCGAQEILVPPRADVLAGDGEALSEFEFSKNTPPSKPLESNGAVPEQAPEDAVLLRSDEEPLKPYEMKDLSGLAYQAWTEQTHGLSSQLQASGEQGDEINGQSESLSELGWKTHLVEADRALFGTAAESAVEEQTRLEPTANKEESAEVAMRKEEQNERALAEPVDSRDETVELQTFHFESSDISTKQSINKESSPVSERSAIDQSLFGSGGVSEAIVETHLSPFESNNVKPIDPVFPIAEEHMERTEKKYAVPDGDGGPQMSYTAVPETRVEMSAAEWFWKTLNIPAGESVYKMTFRIVRGKETLEEIAASYNLTVTQLLHANASLEQPIADGALLYIPLS